MIETFSTNKSCTLVLIGPDLEDTLISLSRYIMVHVG